MDKDKRVLTIEERVALLERAGVGKELIDEVRWLHEQKEKYKIKYNIGEARTETKESLLSRLYKKFCDYFYD